MVFWGVEVKPGKPFRQTADPFDYTKLHLSQATLGLDVKSKDRVVVKCKVGEGPEILLCSLIPGVVESSSLDLLFDQDVVFSVTGSTPVHLTGYYMPINDTDSDEEYDSDDFSEDTDDSEDEEDEEDSDAPMLEAAASAEEIYDDEDQDKDKKSGQIAPKKRKQVELVTNGGEEAEADDDTSADDEKKDAGDKNDEEESEDADGFLVLPAKKTKGAKAVAEPVAKAKVVVQEVTKETPPTKKAKKKAERAEATEAKATTTAKKATTGEVKVKAGDKTPSKAPAVKQEDGKSTSSKKPQVRKHPNGLEIHEVAMGKPDGKQAKLGKRVSVIYTGKLKNGKVFDTNVGKKPFLFRLGVGEVIKGWDIGVEGMRVGDKRKLVIPPLLAYGAEGVGNQIPGNSTLTFDVELVAVK